jgi:hypothetical protein
MRRVDLARLTPEGRKSFDAAVHSMRAEFNALVSGLYPTDQDPARLLAGPLSRSPFVSRLFLDCCRLAYIDALLKEGGVDEIAVDSAPLAAVVSERLRREGSTVRVVDEETAAAALKRTLRPFARLLKGAGRFFLRRAAGVTVPRPVPPGPVTLLDLFVLEGSIRDGRFHDRYYPGLRAALTPEEDRATFYLPEFPDGCDPAALLRAAAATGELFLFKESFLTTGDYLAALLSPLKALRAPAGPRPFRGFDAAALVRADAWETAWNSMSLCGWLNWRFMRRLSEAGISVRLLVDWSENQLVDRGLVLGLRASHPGAASVGYCGYLLSPDRHVYARPTTREREAGLVPDRLVAPGPGLASDLAEFCPGLETADAPAYRFPAARPAPPAGDTAARVLLALPISADGALDSLEAAAGAGGAFDLKAHPALPERALRALWRGPWPESFAFVDGDWAELAAGRPAVAGNTTSALVESLALGVPVVIVAGGRGFTENPVPAWASPESWRLAYGAAEFAEALAELRKADRARLLGLGRELGARCFTPVTEEGTRRLLQLPRSKT